MMIKNNINNHTVSQLCLTIRDTMEKNLKNSILNYKLNNKSGAPVGQILCLWGSRPKLIFEFNDYHQNMLEDKFVNLNFCLN